MPHPPHRFANSVSVNGSTYGGTVTKSASGLANVDEPIPDESTDLALTCNIDVSATKSFVMVADGVVDVDLMAGAHTSVTTNDGVSGNNEIALVVDPATPANYEGGVAVVGGQRRTITTYGGGIYSLNANLSPYPTAGDPVTIFTDVVYEATTVANTPVAWHDDMPSAFFLSGDVTTALVTNDSGSAVNLTISAYQDATP